MRTQSFRWSRFSFLGTLLLLLSLFVSPIRAQIPGLKIEYDVVYGKGGDQDLRLDYCAPENPKGKLPALVFIHGGGWVGGDKKDFHPVMLLFVKEGIACFTVQYRFAPEHPFPAQLEDVKCAIRWVRANAEKYGIDPERIGVIGGSAGAHLAGMLAVTGGQPKWEGKGGNAGVSSHITAAVSLAGPFDLAKGYANSVNQREAEGKFLREVLEKFLGGKLSGHSKRYADASPITHVSSKTAPMLLLHGLKDTLVLPEQSVAMARALEKHQVEYDLFLNPEGDHSVINRNGDQILEKVHQFLRKHLKY